MTTQTTELMETITPMHKEISHLFIDRVVTHLGSQPKLLKYSIDAGSYYDIESCEYFIDEKTTVRISIQKTK